MFRRKKSVITVTFDPYHNLPMMKAKNCSESQILDAALFMQGHARIDVKKKTHKTAKPRKRRESRVHKFFRVLRYVLFDKSSTSVERRMNVAKDPASDPIMLPASL